MTHKKKCRYCKAKYETKYPLSYACPKKKCQAERHRQWRLINKPSTIWEPRECIYCHEDFTVKDHRANRRTHCYTPKCEAEKQRHYGKERVRLAREWRAEKRKQPPSNSARPCKLCGEPLPDDRYFRHDACVDNLDYRVDDDWKYVTGDIEGE